MDQCTVGMKNPGHCTDNAMWLSLLLNPLLSNSLGRRQTTKKIKDEGEMSEKTREKSEFKIGGGISICRFLSPLFVPLFPKNNPPIPCKNKINKPFVTLLSENKPFCSCFTKLGKSNLKGVRIQNPADHV